MYAHEIKRIDALPQGAAETALMAWSPPTETTGCDGRKGARCLATQIGLERRFQLKIFAAINDLPHAWSPSTVRTLKSGINREQISSLKL
jgi:hypothetical protein